MKNSSQEPYYSISNAQVFRPFLRWKATALLIHWIFQGLLYMDKTERYFKLSIDILFTITIGLILSIWFSWQMSVFVGFISAHSINFFFNSQIYVVLKHFGSVRHTKTEMDKYIAKLKHKIQRESSIRCGFVFGSLSREELKETSDLDVRLIRNPGFRNALSSCFFLMFERFSAFLNKFPLDIYLLDSEAPLSRLRKDELPIKL